MSTTTDQETSPMRPTICRGCQQPNPPGHRFCGSCGEPLWEPCLLCGEQNSCDVVYCGQCGGHVQQAFQQRLAEFAAHREKAERLRADGIYRAAIEMLRRIDSQGDSRLQSHAQAAARTVALWQQEQNDRRQEAEVIFQAAQRRLAEQDYGGAYQELKRIAPGLRNEAMRDAWQQVNATLREIRDLTGCVRRAHQANDYDQLLPQVRRLLELRPHDRRLAQLANNLQQRQQRRDVQVAQRRLRECRELIAAHQYEQAAQKLAGIGVQSLPPDQQKAFHTVQELGWMARQLRTAPVVTRQLATIAQRLQRGQPKDARTARQLEELTRRRKGPPPDARFAIPWRKLPPSTQLGCPVRWWRGIQGAEVLADDRPPTSPLFLAYGLALQGLGVARLALNLLPPEPRSWRKRWTPLRSRPSWNPVWGIDLGTSGLKAVELARDSTGSQIQILQTARIPHRSPLNTAENDEQVTAICRDTIQRFVEQSSISQAHAVLGFPGPRSLGRSFEIPRIKASKINEAIAYEAKLQIPVPLEDIHFDWHLWPSDPGGTRMESVTLLAARQVHLRRLLASFDQSPILPVAIQSDCLALYNAAAHEFWSAETANKSHSSLAILEVGTESTNLVLASEESIRYRSLAIGTEKMNRVLTTKFQLPRGKVEALRQKLTGVPWLYQVDQELTPLFAELMAATQRTLAAYQAEGLQADEIFVTGGGSEQHGLLRHFIVGS